MRTVFGLLIIAGLGLAGFYFYGWYFVEEPAVAPPPPPIRVVQPPPQMTIQTEPVVEEPEPEPEPDPVSRIAVDLLEEEDPAPRARLLRLLMEEHPDSPEALDVIEREARRCGDEGDVGLEWEALSFVFLRLKPGERRDLTRQRLDEIVDRIIFSPRPGPYSELYRIEPGDNLDKIAARFNCPKDLIVRMNRIKDPNLIQEGQRLKVLQGAREVLVPVGPGMTMQTIADAHDTTLEELLAFNEMEDPTVEPGDRVKVQAGAFDIHVSKADFTLTVLWHGKYARQYPVGIGLDDRTPEGDFTVSDRIKDPAWYNEGERIPSGDARNILGTRWIGFKETDVISGIGIHGTTQPDTIGTESSAGCIRLRNEDVEELCLLTPRGTTVRIR